METRVELRDFLNLRGAIVGALVIALALGYHHWRRSSMGPTASAEAEKYLKAELPARYVRGESGPIDTQVMEDLKDITITDVKLPLFASEKPRVRVTAEDGLGNEHKLEVRLKRGTGEWRVVSVRFRTGPELP